MRVIACYAIVALSSVSASCAPEHDPAAPSRESSSASRTPRYSPVATPVTILACGAAITSDVTLGNDLSCDGTALTVSGDGIRIDLNGHMLTGVGVGNGIMVTSSHDVTIFGGTVQGFVSGIFAGGSSGLVIRDNELTLNREAVLLQATTGSVIMHNVAASNQSRAFMIRPNLAGASSTDNLIFDNLVTGTPTGVYLIHQPGNIVRRNTISGASVAAIDLAAGAGSVSDNVIEANLLIGGGVGIRFGSGWGGNRFVGNRIGANTCGTQGSTSGNTLNGNVFWENADNECP